MLTKNKKIIVFFLLILLGAALITYGTVFHSRKVFPQKDDGPPPVAKSEPALIKDASVSGLIRDKSGKIKQTYTGKAPKACAT
ncbi:MAG: hypothetical protein GY774_07985 [Planctomycetes bacterium]|nr:hypothetical protein [Planctomycetota bacterium]